jgi:hypothetical protein
MKTAFRRALPGLLASLALCAPARAGETKDLEKTPQAKTYQALLAAVAAEDFEAYKKCMTKASVEGIEQETKGTGLDPKKAMALLKEMSPAELKYVALEVKDRKATLLATGKVFGEANRGTIDFEQEDGHWKVARQSWTNRE